MKCIFSMEINIEVLHKLIYHFGFVQPGMPKVPKTKSLHIFGLSPENRRV